jgi:hypothetical protein
MYVHTHLATQAIRNYHADFMRLKNAQTCRSPKLRKDLTPVRVTMLQATPHAIHFNRVLKS